MKSSLKMSTIGVATEGHPYERDGITGVVGVFVGVES